VNDILSECVVCRVGVGVGVLVVVQGGMEIDGFMDLAPTQVSN